MDPEQYQDDPRSYALELVENGIATADSLLLAALQYMSHDDVRGMLDANELSPRFDDDTDELADELRENGLDDVAEHLEAHGAAATRSYVADEIAESRAHDDPEGWRLGNLEVARDRLADAD